ncbi:MAG: ElaB/YqjD/DUF883 family membrane-anchored ribosome-binding protein [Gammaproteobacteria bacterium]|jgi:ElaB/YqjD/DUF883 family membrane-anchored ribosome-binding protein
MEADQDDDDDIEDEFDDDIENLLKTASRDKASNNKEARLKIEALLDERRLREQIGDYLYLD